MISIPLVRSFWGQPFIRFFTEIGAPVDRYLEESKLPEEVAEASEIPCPSPLMYQLLAKLAHDEGLLHEGLRVAEKTQIRTWGGFGRLVASEPTLLHAIQTAQRLMPAVHSARTLTFSCDGQQARLSSKSNGALSASSPWEDHFFLLMMIDLVKMAAGPGWRPEEVALETGCFNGWRDCEILSGARVRQGDVATEVQFPRVFLSRRLDHGRPARFSEGQSECRDFDTSPLPTDLENSLCSTLELLVPQGYVAIDTAAEVTGVSRRTLQRHLSECGTSYSDILARARLGLATRRLEDSSYKVIDVAYDTGYSDPAHFTKAFRRWTGFNPQAYRVFLSEPQPLA
jgi:AraC-like DNA-binding protein